MSQLPALLRTDLSQMAERVRRAGRGPDTMLAHITPKEAALLRAQGGSGTMNPMTGLPEFFDYENEQYNPVYQEIPETPPSDIGYESIGYQLPSPQDSRLTQPVVKAFSQGDLGEGAFQYPAPTISPEAMAGPRASMAPFEIGRTAPGTPGIREKIAGLGEVPQANISKIPFPSTKAPGGEDIGAALRAGAKNIGQVLQTPLGYGAIGAIPALVQARRASRQAQQLQQELGRLGQEARTQGQELLQQARSGQITATQQQQLEAQRAAALQNLSRRGITGGTAVQQLEQSLQNQRGRFLEDTLNQGLRLINVGDQYTSQAIRAGYQADAQAQQLLGNFFNNYMRVLAGQAQPQSAPGTSPSR